jgi:hypothetical protein
MSINDSGLRDDVSTEFTSGGTSDDARAEPNRTDTEGVAIGDLDPFFDHKEIARRRTEQPAGLPARPADGAAKTKWVDYVVALGADRAHVLGETAHHNADTGRPEQSRALGRDELIELAGGLGG